MADKSQWPGGQPQGFWEGARLERLSPPGMVPAGYGSRGAFGGHKDVWALGAQNVQVWSVPERHWLQTLGPCSKGDVSSLAWVLGDRALVRSCVDGLWLTWVEDGRHEKLWSERCVSVSVSKQGDHVALVDNVGGAVVLDLDGGGRWEIPAHKSPLTVVELDGAGQHVATVAGRSVRVFRVGEGKKERFKGSVSTAPSKVRLSADGQVVAAWHSKTTLATGALSKPKEGLKLWTLKAPVLDMAFEADGHNLWYVTKALRGKFDAKGRALPESDAVCVNGLTGKAVRTVGVFDLASRRRTLAPDGRWVACYSSGHVDITQLPGGMHVPAVSGDSPLPCVEDWFKVERGELLPQDLRARSNDVQSRARDQERARRWTVAAAPKGYFAGLGRASSKMMRASRVWMAQRWQSTLSPDAKRVALSLDSYGFDVICANVVSGKHCWRLEVGSRRCLDVAWSAKGKRCFILARHDQSVTRKGKSVKLSSLHCLDGRKGQVLYEVDGLNVDVHSLVWLNEKEVMAYSQRHYVVFESKTGKVVRDGTFSADCVKVCRDLRLGVLASRQVIDLQTHGVVSQLDAAVEGFSTARGSYRILQFLADGQLLVGLQVTADAISAALWGVQSGRFVAHGRLELGAPDPSKDRLPSVLATAKALWIRLGHGALDVLFWPDLEALIPEVSTELSEAEQQALDALKSLAAVEPAWRRWQGVWRALDEWESDGPVEQAVAMLGEAGVGGPMPSSWVSRLASGAVFECAALSTEMLVDVRAHGPDSTRRLLKAPELASLKALSIHNAVGRDKVFEALAESAAEGLESLDVVGSQLSGKDCAALNNAAMVKTLKKLRLEGSTLPMGGLRKAFAKKALGQLRQLVLIGNGNVEGDELCRLLKGIKHITSLERFEWVQFHGWKTFLWPQKAKHLQSLRTLRLEPLGPVDSQHRQDIIASLAAHLPTSIEHLSLRGLVCDLEDVETLCAGAFAATVRELTLAPKAAALPGALERLTAAFVALSPESLQRLQAAAQEEA